MAFHVESLTREFVRSGMSEAEAEKVRTFESALAESLAREQLNALVSGGFALSGLLLASYMPASRAARVEPLVALRQD